MKMEGILETRLKRNGIYLLMDVNQTERQFPSRMEIFQIEVFEKILVQERKL